MNPPPDTASAVAFAERRLQPFGPRLAGMTLLALLAGCANGEFEGDAPGGAVGEVVLPDTQTVDGVLVMRHDADAFARAPQWSLDTTPLVVIDGGEAPDFDLTFVYDAIPLSDGRFIAFSNAYGAKLRLFGAEGGPERLLAGTGQGPGELMAASQPVVLPGDTIVIVDETNDVANWYHPDTGLLRSERLGHPFSSCLFTTGLLANRRLVAMGRCLAFRLPEDGTTRPPIPLVTADPDYGQLDTVAMMPGYEMVEVETRRRGRRAIETAMLQLGRHPSATAADSLILVATGEHGYMIELLREDGVTVGRIEVAVARRPVTEELRERVITAELEQIDTPGREGRVDPDEDRRLAREAPFPDSLPSYSGVLAGADGVWWVLDYRAPGDSTWSATAFRLDGAILGRVSGRRNPDEYGSGPVWFGRDRVIVREVDGDGVVRFGVYSIVKGEG